MICGINGLNVKFELGEVGIYLLDQKLLFISMGHGIDRVLSLQIKALTL